MRDDVQLIRVSQGAIEDLWPVSVQELLGKDISLDTVTVGLGSAEVVPAAWQAPIITWVSDSSFTASLRIDSTYPGTLDAYYFWVKVEDSPEVILLRAHKVVVR